ncbi:multicopper oxidase-domain-containing protein [Fomitopsis serialis]|uniref:multicopper oxidase-domain-containing protein n=1 Tax=Fomitopsis serialis TaxID=139415 RepID=UPI002008BC20|nr:multicopper oxidase-domain-containing protein [Neoantrodia serialis]KAH9934150.1 multicopper oxidase-domain-containing protein [Neoantrodia serialis]
MHFWLVVMTWCDSTVYFTMAMEYPAGQDESTSKYLAFINETSWEPLNNTSSLFSHLGNATPTGSSNFDGSQLMTTVNDVSVVEMIIDNLDDGDHPFHLHGYKFWIMDGGDGRWQGQTPNNTTPMLRDTVVIPAYTWMILRFVADNPGYWAFHCHIQWHMAAGLLFQFNILPAKSAQFRIPQYMLDMCGK